MLSVFRWVWLSPGSQAFGAHKLELGGMIAQGPSSGHHMIDIRC